VNDVNSYKSIVTHQVFQVPNFTLRLIASIAM
jgi:hypothetical protein